MFQMNLACLRFRVRHICFVLSCFVKNGLCDPVNSTGYSSSYRKHDRVAESEYNKTLMSYDLNDFVYIKYNIYIGFFQLSFQTSAQNRPAR